MAFKNPIFFSKSYQDPMGSDQGAFCEYSFLLASAPIGPGLDEVFGVFYAIRSFPIPADIDLRSLLLGTAVLAAKIHDGLEILGPGKVVLETRHLALRINPLHRMAAFPIQHGGYAVL